MTAKRKPPTPHSKAERHLAKCHEGLRTMIRRVGPCTLTPSPDPFRALVRTIISQQLSTTVANSIGRKLEQVLGPDGPTPARIVAATDDVMRGCGLSGAKAKSLRDLSTKVLDGSLAFHNLVEQSDDHISETLQSVHGIGPWSVDMFLIFCLGRTDVLPVGNLGLRVGMKELFGLSEVPPPKTLFELAEPWRPYRSIATWFMWRNRDT